MVRRKPIAHHNQFLGLMLGSTSRISFNYRLVIKGRHAGGP